jgi:hypothetical protein
LKSWARRFAEFSVGSIHIDDVTYRYEVVIDRGEVRKRNKEPLPSNPAQTRAMLVDRDQAEEAEVAEHLPGAQYH